MKIVTFDEFVKLPKGTVYCEWEPAVASGLFVKDESITFDGDAPRDFFTQPLLPRHDGDPDVVIFPDYGERWGMYEFDQLFAVYEANDVARLIDLLQGKE